MLVYCDIEKSGKVHDIRIQMKLPYCGSYGQIKHAAHTVYLVQHVDHAQY